MSTIQPNRQQQARDRDGERDACAACGAQAGPRNPLVLAGDGCRVHVSHVITPGDGYFGTPFQEAS